MADAEEYSGEKCVKCGEEGEDRRTLWMACFYAMEELGVPFEEVQIKGTVHELDWTERKPLFLGGPTMNVSHFKEEQRGSRTDHRFYTLRVCKNCRADWMSTIKDWFNSALIPQAGCGSGIFVRENGVNVEITLEEWERRRQQRKGEA